MAGSSKVINSHRPLARFAAFLAMPVGRTLLTCPHISCFRRFATGFLRHKYDSPTLGVIVSLVGIVTLISYLVLRL
jgi:hypothetical protein